MNPNDPYENVAGWLRYFESLAKDRVAAARSAKAQTYAEVVSRQTAEGNSAAVAEADARLQSAERHLAQTSALRDSLNAHFGKPPAFVIETLNSEKD